MAKDKQFCGLSLSAELCGRIAMAAKRQGRKFSEEVELRLSEFYQPKRGE